MDWLPPDDGAGEAPVGGAGASGLLGVAIKVVESDWDATHMYKIDM